MMRSSRIRLTESSKVRSEFESAALVRKIRGRTMMQLPKL